MPSRILRILFDRQSQGHILLLLFIMISTISQDDTIYAGDNKNETRSDLLIAKNLGRNPEYTSTLKRRGDKQTSGDAVKAARNVSKIENRIRELEVLEPALKAEVLAVTKMAAKANTIKERKAATKRIRESENNAIAVIKELKGLRRELEAAKGEELLARNAAGMGPRVAKFKPPDLSSIDRKFHGLDEVGKRNKVTKRVSPEVVEADPNIKRRKAKKLSSELIDAAGRRTYVKQPSTVGKRAFMKQPVSPIIKESEFEDVLGDAESNYEKALEKHFSAFMTLLDTISTGDNTKVVEDRAQEQYDDAREDLLKAVEKMDKP